MTDIGTEVPAGEEFLRVLADPQRTLVTDLVAVQKADLSEIVDRRRDIATLLRRFMVEESVDSAAVMILAGRYGELDGEIVYSYATTMARAAQSLTAAQRAGLAAMADSLGYIHPPGAFLYSRPVAMPPIIDTDFLFAAR